MLTASNVPLKVISTGGRKRSCKVFTLDFVEHEGPLFKASSCASGIEGYKLYSKIE